MADVFVGAYTGQAARLGPHAQATEVGGANICLLTPKSPLSPLVAAPGVAALATVSAPHNCYPVQRIVGDTIRRTPLCKTRSYACPCHYRNNGGALPLSRARRCYNYYTTTTTTAAPGGSCTTATASTGLSPRAGAGAA